MNNRELCQSRKDLLEWLIPYKDWDLEEVIRGKMCWACNKETSSLYKCHIVARCHNGDNNDPENYFLLCHRCHLDQPDGCSVLIQERWLRDRESYCSFLLREIMRMVKEAQESTYGHTEERFLQWESSLDPEELVRSTFKKAAGVKNGLGNLGETIKERYGLFLRANYA